MLKKERAFLFNRPATTLELIKARWHACARAVLIGSLPLLAIIVIASFFQTDIYPGVPLGAIIIFGVQWIVVSIPYVTAAFAVTLVWVVSQTQWRIWQLDMELKRSRSLNRPE